MKKLFLLMLVASLGAMACNDEGTSTDGNADTTPPELTDTLPPVVVDTTITTDTLNRQ